MNRTDISELRIERDNFKLVLRKHEQYGYLPMVPGNTSVPAAPAISSTSPPAISAVTSNDKEVASKTEATADESKLITIKSPMIGTFYRSSSPDKPSFVNVGDEIKPGTVLCIIEAMKLFNEIESEHSGRIVKILSENAKPVEYDQPLFLIEPM